MDCACCYLLSFVRFVLNYCSPGLGFRNIGDHSIDESQAPVARRSKEMKSMRTFTLEELSEFDGSNGKPAYVAFNGKVYDVTNGPNWAVGAHYEHTAGEDLTEDMQYAPHGEDFIDEFPVVGELAP